MGRWRLTALLLPAAASLAALARADFKPGWVCFGPGMCLNGGKDQCAYRAGQTAGPPPATPEAPAAINVYIDWYNNASRPWPSAQQHAIVDGVFGNLNGSPWWTALTSYYPYNSLNKGVSQNATISITNCFSGSPAHCYTDPESQGTNNVIPETIIRAAITGGHLPSDNNGLYFVLPSTNDMTGQPSIGQNGGGGPNGGIEADREFCNPGPCTGACMWSNYATPNGDCQFDVQIHTMFAEMAGAFGNFFGNGWHASPVCPGLTEIHENCSLGANVQNAFETPSNTSANWTAQLLPTRYDFITYSIWIPAQGGLCETQTPPSFWTMPCQTNSDCPAYSGVCGLAQPDTRAVPAPGQDAIIKHCLPSTCLDGIKNGTETDIDCGGECATCVAGQHCNADIGCRNAPFFCDGGTCQ